MSTRRRNFMPTACSTHYIVAEATVLEASVVLLSDASESILRCYVNSFDHSQLKFSDNQERQGESFPL